ncbi:hypothetical protein MVI01_65640 [Myxococcus virescens]|uniref:Uncharacterized protein n=1 Tax=Myxococcus virescens TaxID=83456 RepID=A0A511HMH9_9BACT|nr:hypothetical protein MVI01_65640 [Myxococcus virescens]
MLEVLRLHPQLYPGLRARNLAAQRGKGLSANLYRNAHGFQRTRQKPCFSHRAMHGQLHAPHAPVFTEAELGSNPGCGLAPARPMGGLPGRAARGGGP